MHYSLFLNAFLTLYNHFFFNLVIKCSFQHNTRVMGAAGKRYITNELLWQITHPVYNHDNYTGLYHFD